MHLLTQEYPKGHFRQDCRLCHSTALDIFLDFGMHPHSDGFVPADRLLEPEPYFPLAMQFCTECGQVQIHYIVDPLYLYGQDYLYDSTITDTGRKHFLGMAETIVTEHRIPKGSLTVDIGSNVGLLLSGFREQGMNVQGVDPTPRMTEVAIANGLSTIQECFSATVASNIVAEKGKAMVITGTNVVAHIDDLDDFMTGVDTLLAENGILVIEAPYLGELIDKLEYDTVYHQHLSYFSVSPLARFFKRFGMELFDVKKTTIHGGSIRLFVARKGMKTVQPIVDEMIRQESANGLLTAARMHRFADDVRAHRLALITLLVELKNKGKRLAGIGAPAKGSTLLNFCGINSSLLDFVTEKNTLKVGRYTPGTHIPILEDLELLKTKPDYALILAWNFAPEIMANLHAYKEQGGKFIIPIPSPHIV